MLDVQLLARAEQEVKEAYAWYEEKQQGLGERFLTQIDRYLSFIGSNPYVYPSRYGNELHVAPVKLFPYLIVYWVDESKKIVFVVSVFHTSRKPEDFKERDN
ncbi:type II toxin-antitoxin system RelE/ParE family toxin [Botryobacter ruber]|uniref:type II toxin-antitoxin system RelE/ParE family toxin n=1 Tax=Botryobacter ruber TaxID=2171629 RepID=UPI000E0B5AC3|nr:type II toxin-antitoxin system RelE/ParE family toxin [Botryobacter ruber]